MSRRPESTRSGGCCRGRPEARAYLQYAEHARWELLRAAGLPREKLLADGIGPVQLEVTVKYLRELRGGERVRVTCRFDYGTGKTFTLEQRIIKEDGTVAAEITGVGGVLDLTERRLVPDPRGRLAALAGDPDLLTG
ncbi:thioesterase family protein [Streptomyces sp. V2I9]|uniref:acyl-CoA thioesterase n=1 Tax=Streptomyces sp. V2I9 TaxID=3042304 RepID=UPI002786675C|nr:acyl-CoA thioesterase [Streptomyces sp. V2I9]MDQ0982921.1 acyl-CoA thioester hydrolase [Streptomyces sp. V2I9]